MRARVHALDGLRAVAASLVVIHHLWGVGPASSLVAYFLHSATAAGVDLFFVLSGVVLGQQYIRQDRPMIPLDYFRRRAQRLWPPYVVAWLLAGMTIAVTTAWPTWWSISAYLPAFDWGAWLGQAFIVNWWSTPYSFAWWSLTVEVSFYVILPLLIPTFRAIRHQPVILFSVFCGASLLSGVAYRSMPIPVIGDLVNYSSCFTAGLVLASREVSARAAYAALVSGIFMTVASIVLPSVNPHIGWAFLYFGIVATALDTSSPLSKRLSSDFLVWLGERSYSLFLTHHTCIVLTYWAISLLVDAKGPTYYLASRSVAVVLSLLVAMVLFNFVERRFATGLVTADRFWPLPTRAR